MHKAALNLAGSGGGAEFLAQICHHVTHVTYTPWVVSRRSYSRTTRKHLNLRSHSKQINAEAWGQVSNGV